MLPTTLWGKSPCEVAESVIRRPQNTSSWTGSEAECRDAVCVGVLRNSTQERSLPIADRARLTVVKLRLFTWISPGVPSAGFTRHKKSELRAHQMARNCGVPGSLRTKSELSSHQMARMCDQQCCRWQCGSIRNWRKWASLHLVQCSPMCVMSQRNVCYIVFSSRHSAQIDCSPNRLHELPDGTFSLFAPNAPVAQRIVPSSRREGDCS